MSKEAITKVVQRAISDAAFRRQLSTDPTGALRGFDLSTEETAAIRTGDAGRLSAMGVDQRMSKAFALGGATVGASRAAGSDLANASSVMASDPTTATAGAYDGALVSGGLSANDALISDGASARPGIIPTEPHIRTADADGAVASASRAINDDPDGFLAAADARASGGADSVRSAISDDPDGFLAASAARAAGESGAATASRAINDDPDGFLAANADTGTAARTARVGDDWKFSASSQANAAPIDGSPEASAAELSRGGGMAAYPPHGGLAGPSQVGQDAGGSAARANAINDDPDGFLAANARADVAGSTSGTPVEDSEGYLTSVGYDAGVSTSAAVTDAHDRGDPMAASTAAVTDAHDRGGKLAASASGGGSASGGETAYIDDSESYLTSVGYDTTDSTSAVTDAHDRGGDNIVTRIDDDDAAGTSAATEDGPISS